MDDEDVLSFLRRLLTREATSEVADRVVREIQTTLGGQRHYISAAPNDRRDEALRLLDTGHAPKDVAHRLRVDVSTVYRWRQRHRRRLATSRNPGLGRDGWNL